MLVCSCKGITDRKIQEEVRKGARSLRQIQDGCQAGTDCGHCVRHIRRLLSLQAQAARSVDGDRDGTSS